MEFAWELPEGLTQDGRARSEKLVTCRIVNEVTLKRGVPWVEVNTTIANAARDHYLRVSFPSGLKTDAIAARTPFDVVSREIPTPDYSQFDDLPQTEQPWQGFVDVSDGLRGLAILGDGLRAYEAHDDADRTVSLTLLRSLALRFYVPDRVDDTELAATAQCPGQQQFRYAVMPHAGEWASAEVWRAAEVFNTPLLALQFAPTSHGQRPRVGSFLEVTPHHLHLSAVKESESGDGVVVRLFNPNARAVEARVRLGGGFSGPLPPASPVAHAANEYVLASDTGAPWREIRTVTLEEEPIVTLMPDAEGWVAVAVPGKRIVTLEFVR